MSFSLSCLHHLFPQTPLYLTYHHSPAHLPLWKHPAYMSQASRFSVQFHSQDNHHPSCEVSLIFIKHRNAGPSSPSLPQNLGWGVWRGYYPSIHFGVSYFSQTPHSLHSVTQIWKLEFNYTESKTGLAQPRSSLLWCRRRQQQSITPLVSQTRLQNLSPSSPGSHHPSARAVIGLKSTCQVQEALNQARSLKSCPMYSKEWRPFAQ